MYKIVLLFIENYFLYLISRRTFDQLKNVKIMDSEKRKQLISIGRADLVEIFDINQSGYAGINPEGHIVDRRKFPEAIAIQKNSLFNIPEPRKLDSEK